MKTYTHIPKHYYRLKEGDTVRKGDIFVGDNNSRRIESAWGIIGEMVGSFPGKVWRRRHIKIKKEAPIEKYPFDRYPLVKFFYPKSNGNVKRSNRVVRLISADDTYLLGLEISDKHRKCHSYHLLNLI
jgi:hypothetical protein